VLTTESRIELKHEALESAQDKFLEAKARIAQCVMHDAAREVASVLYACMPQVLMRLEQHPHLDRATAGVSDAVMLLDAKKGTPDEKLANALSRINECIHSAGYDTIESFEWLHANHLLHPTTHALLRSTSPSVSLSLSLSRSLHR